MARTKDPFILVEIPPNAPPHIYCAAAEQCIERGQGQNALRISNLGLERNPSYTSLRLYRAEALRLCGEAENGEDDLRAVLAAEPQHPRALKCLSGLLMTQERFEEALPVLERAEFILMNDPDIGRWIEIAEQAIREAEEHGSAPSGTMSEADIIGRLTALVDTPGVLGVSLRDGDAERHGGPEWSRMAPAMEPLRGMEGRVGLVLSDVGFGALVDSSLHRGETTLTAHHKGARRVCVMADGRAREGLIAWQCRKALAEDTND